MIVVPSCWKCCWVKKQPWQQRLSEHSLCWSVCQQEEQFRRFTWRIQLCRGLGRHWRTKYGLNFIQRRLFELWEDNYGRFWQVFYFLSVEFELLWGAKVVQIAAFWWKNCLTFNSWRPSFDFLSCISSVKCPPLSDITTIQLELLNKRSKNKAQIHRLSEEDSYWWAEYEAKKVTQPHFSLLGRGTATEQKNLKLCSGFRQSSPSSC